VNLSKFIKTPFYVKKIIDSVISSSNMNWTCLVYGAPMLIALLWFVVDAHKWFKGPRVNVKHAMIGQNIKDFGRQA